MQPAKNWSVVPLPAPVNHLVVNMTAKLIMTTNMMVKFVMMINMMEKLIMTTNLMSLIMMMVKMMNKMSRMTIVVLVVVAVKLKLSCLV